MDLSAKLLALVAVAVAGGMSLHILYDAMIDSCREETIDLLMEGEQLPYSCRALQTIGVLTQDQAQQQAKAALSALDADMRGDYWVATSDGINFMRSSVRFIGTRAKGGRTTDGLTDREVYRAGMARAHVVLVDVVIMRSPDADVEPKLQDAVAIPGWAWWVGTGFLYDDMNAAFSQLALLPGAIALAIAATPVASRGTNERRCSADSRARRTGCRNCFITG